MFKYYCKFFDENTKEENNRIVGIKETINTRFNNFIIKVFINDFDINHSKITDYKILVERKINGTYSFVSFINGEVDAIQNQITFSGNVPFVDGENIDYRITLSFYAGGILIYNGSDYSFNFILKTECEDYKIDIDNSIEIGDYVELKNEENIENIKFFVNVNDSPEYNTLMYYYDFSPEESIEPKEFKVFGNKFKEFNYIVATSIFKNDFTYLHFFMKDSFGNIRYKKIKIITKENVNELLQIISGDIYLSNINDQFNIFYNMKNIREVKMKLIIDKENEQKTIAISSKSLGLKENTSNFVSITLNEYFENINELVLDAKKIEFCFTLNGSEKESNNRILLLYDNDPPNILLNLENDYALTKEDKDFFNVTGQVRDNNFFYIGINIKKYDFKDVSNWILLYSKENISSINLDSSSVKPIKLGNYYIASITGKITSILNENGEEIECSYIDDYAEENQKILFINLNKNLLSTYERNLLANNKLCVKGDILNSTILQETVEIGNYYIIKIIINSTTVGESINFDLGVEEFDYSFLKYIDDSSVSCELKRDKSLNLSFTDTRLIPIKTNNSTLFKIFTNQKVISNKSSLIIDDISFITLSLKDNEFFTSEQTHIFFDNNLNTKETSNIFAFPLLQLKEKEIEYKNYNITKIENGIYNFNLDVPIANGINNLKITFSDILENSSSKEFVIEKQLKEIEVVIDETESHDIIFKKENDITVLSTKKDSVMLKLIVKNQTYKNLNEEKYLIVVSNNSSSKFKIINEENISYCYIDLYNQNYDNLYYVYYDNIDSTVKLTLRFNKIQDLYLDCLNEVVTGSSAYFLKLDKDPFSIITIEHDNHEKVSCSYVEKNNVYMVEVKRLDDKKFIEKVNLTIKAQDNKNIFQSVNKNVKITFYNDTLISDYFIQPSFIINDKIISNLINLEIITYEKENIKSIAYYDLLELDFYKRKKYAIYENGSYIIKNIVTPLEASYLDIEIELNTDEEIKITKRLFEDEPIYISEENEKLTVSYEKGAKEFVIRIKNQDINTIKLKKIEILKDDIAFDQQEEFVLNPSEIKSFNYNIFEFTGNCKFQIRITNEYGKITLLESEIVDFTNNNLNADIVNLKEYNLLETKETDIIIFDNKSHMSGFKLKIKDVFDISKEYDLLDGNNYINIIGPGIYSYILFNSANPDYILKKYNVEVVSNKNEVIEIKNNSYITCDFINELVVENKSSIPINLLNPKIEYYINDNFIKEISYKDIIDRNIHFIIEKKFGLNKYVYKDNFLTKQLSEIQVNKIINEKPEVYNIHTDNNVAFFKEKNVITLESQNPVYFSTKEISYAKIYSLSINRVFKKTIINGYENMIPKAFIPCVIDFYDASDNKIKNLTYEIKIINKGVNNE